MDVTYTDDGLVVFKCFERIQNIDICKTGKCHGAKLNDTKEYNIICGHGYMRLSWTEYAKYKNTNEFSLGMEILNGIK